MKYSQYNLFVNNPKTGKTILFNTLTGHYFSVDDETKQHIESKEVEGLPEVTKKMFTDYSILINDNIDETRYFEYYYNKQKYSTASVNSTVLLTWACNLKCVYCYEGAGEVKNTVMSKETADRYIKFIKNEATSKRAPIISINLFGGEPLLNIDLGFYILEELNKFCVETEKILYSSIITNGTLITEEILQKLEKYNCISLQITLDGTKEIHNSRRMYKNDTGSFDKIIENIMLFKNREGRIKLVIRINVDKSNLEETYKLLKYLEDTGINNHCHVDFGIVRGSTQSCSSYAGNCFIDEEIGDVLEKLWESSKRHGFISNIKPMRRWMYCGLYGDSAYTIAPNGDMYKCWEHVGEVEHRMGKLNDEGVVTNLGYNFFDWMTRNPIETGECKQCKYLPSCGGGCGVNSYNKDNTYHSSGCFKIKGVVEKQILQLVNAK